MIHIGDLAARSGKSVHALRYYEKEGLIPNVRRDAAGRRVYTERHVLWVELLTRLRATGMPVDDVREYAQMVAEGDATLAQRQEFLRAHRAKVLGQIGDLEACVSLIDTKISMYQSWLDAGGSPIEELADIGAS